MIAQLFGSLGLQAGLKLSRGVILALVIGGLFAAGGLGFWRGMATIERMVTASAEAATATANALNKAAIEASNAAVARDQALREAEAARASARAENEITGLRKALSDMEKANAALPNGAAGGLDRARVRLLRNN